MTDPKQEELLKQIVGDGKPKKLAIVAGAYGDMDDCEAIVEKVITPEEGGTFLKLYGCSYLYKGYPLNEVVESMGLAKALISFVPKEFILKSPVAILYFIFLILFNRKRFYELVGKAIYLLHDRCVTKPKIHELRYNKMSTNLRWSMRRAAEQEYGKIPDEDFAICQLMKAIKDKKLRVIVPMVKLADFIILCLELDNAYRFRFQDVILYLDKRNDPVKELMRLIDIIIGRENDTAVKEKLKAYRKLLYALHLFPTAKRVLKNFLDEIDIKQVALDEDDYYFCLKRKGYNFRGKTIEERLEEKKQIDKEKGHIFISVHKGPPPPELVAQG